LAIFDFEVIGLPKASGSIVFSTTHREMKTIRQANQSGEFGQSSDKDDIPDPRGDGKVSMAYPTAGWFVDPKSVTAQMTHTEGDWEDHKNRSTTAGAAWSFVTVHHGIGESGKIRFILHWTEYQDQLVDVTNQDQADLNWGESKIFAAPSGGSWSAKYIQFNGRSFDIGSSGFQNPFLKVQTSENNVTFVTPPYYQ
jgi:hypothetical protein